MQSGVFMVELKNTEINVMEDSVFLGDLIRGKFHKYSVRCHRVAGLSQGEPADMPSAAQQLGIW